MTLDLAVLALLAVASLLGAASGALRQLVQLAAVVLGWLAARQLGAHVAAGLAKSVGPLLGRAFAPLLLFLGVFAAGSLAGAIVLRATGLYRAVRTPVDRGIGALLGGAKGAIAAWVLLSALALAGGSAPGWIARPARGSDLAALAARHNLFARLDPGPARAPGRR